MADYTYKSLRREVSKKVHTEDGRGMKTVPDGYETADLEIVIDVEGLAKRLGIRAMKNRSSVAVLCWGLVKVKATNRKRIAA